jgi:hypothetical protein
MLFAKLEWAFDALKMAARRPWFSAATATLGAIVGLFGSIFSSEIKNAFPFAFGDYFVWQAAVFYFSLGMFAFVFREQMQGQGAVLQESAERLEELIRTLPPEEFLKHFEDYVVTAGGEVVRAGDPSVGVDGAKDAALAVLMTLLLLTEMFDGGQKTGRYAINLMLFKQRPIEDHMLSSFFADLNLWETGRSFDELQGMLVLDLDFALALSKETSEGVRFDDNATPLRLPVLQPEFYLDKYGRNNVLPGAPEVYCCPVEPVICKDTRNLASDWRSNSGLRPEIADEIEAYFKTEQGKLVRSFVSLPVLEPPESMGKYAKIVGVINIHSNKPDILGQRAKELFFPLATTFTLMLGAVVRKLNRLEATSNQDSHESP